MVGELIAVGLVHKNDQKKFNTFATQQEKKLVKTHKKN